VLKLKHHY